MDLLNNLLLGLSVAGSVDNLWYCFIGCLIGTLVGVLPGVGPIATISMLLPMTYMFGPVPGIIMLAGVYYGAQYGGSTTSILLNMPGEVSSIMTCVDGNQLTQQGRPGVAILVAGISSFIAGCVATILIALFSPPLSELAFKFGPAEYCMLMLLGFVSVSLITTGDIVKGLSITLLGVLLGLVGTDVNSGVERFTFGWLDLSDGIGFANIAVGVFGLTEIVKNIRKQGGGTLYQSKLDLMPRWDDVKRLLPSAVRGSLIGSFFGLIPGGGTAISSYAAYAFDKKVSKNKDKFGYGAIEGVAAPEAANNAAAQTGFIPLLSLGIPENAVMALMLGALVINGIQPGPGIVEKQPELFWGLLVSMLIGNAMLLVLNVPLVRIWVTLLKVPYQLLYPVLIAVCCIGIYTVNNNLNDILITAFFGIIGYLLLIYELEPSPLMLGIILGPMFEENLRRQLALSQGNFMVFVERPISLSILSVVAILVISGVVILVRKRLTA